MADFLSSIKNKRKRHKNLFDDLRETRDQNRAIQANIDENYAAAVAPITKKAADLEQKQLEIFRQQEEGSFFDLFRGTGGLLDAIGQAKGASLERKQKRLLFEGSMLQSQHDRITAARELALERTGKREQFIIDDIEFNDKDIALDESLTKLEISKANLGIAQNEEIRKQTLDTIKSADKETLMTWLQDPSSAPADIQNKRGLISLHLNDVVSQELAISSSRVQLGNAQKAFQLDAIGSDQLEQIMAAQSPIPKGLDQGDIEQEFNRRATASMDLRSARAAAASGDIELQDMLKQRVMQRMSDGDYAEALVQAEENEGAIEIDGVEFFTQELLVGAQNRQIADQERNQQLTTALIENAGSDAVVHAAEEQGIYLQSLLSPGSPTNSKQPFSGLGAQFQAELIAAKGQYNAAKSVNNPTAAAEAARRMNDKIQAIKQGIIDSAPKEAKGGYEEFANTGRINNAGNAAGVLMSQPTNPNAYAHNSFMAGPWAVFAETLNELRDNSSLTFATDDSGNLTFPSGKKADPNVLINQAVEDSGFIPAYVAATEQKLVIDSVKNLIDNNKEQAEIWKDIYDPTTESIAEFAYEGLGTDDVKFSLGRLSELLALKTAALKEQGVLGGGQNLAEILVEQMKALLVPSSNEMFKDDINLAALKSAAFNNQPHTVMLESFNTLISNSANATINAEEARQTILSNEMIRQKAVNDAFNPPKIGNFAMPVPSVQNMMAVPAAVHSIFNTKESESQNLLRRFLGQ